MAPIRLLNSTTNNTNAMVAPSEYQEVDERLIVLRKQLNEIASSSSTVATTTITAVVRMDDDDNNNHTNNGSGGGGGDGTTTSTSTTTTTTTNATSLHALRTQLVQGIQSYYYNKNNALLLYNNKNNNNNMDEKKKKKASTVDGTGINLWPFQEQVRRKKTHTHTHKMTTTTTPRGFWFHHYYHLSQGTTSCLFFVYSIFFVCHFFLCVIHSLVLLIYDCVFYSLYLYFTHRLICICGFLH